MFKIHWVCPFLNWKKICLVIPLIHNYLTVLKADSDMLLDPQHWISIMMFELKFNFNHRQFDSMLKLFSPTLTKLFNIEPNCQWLQLNLGSDINVEIQCWGSKNMSESVFIFKNCCYLITKRLRNNAMCLIKIVYHFTLFAQRSLWMFHNLF